MKPWLRIIDLTIGPLEEWRGSASGSVIGIRADGTPAGLRVACQIQKTLMGIPGPSVISVYNLARDTRDALRAGLTKISVRAGYANGEQPVAFQGSIVSIRHERTGADIVTKISALPGAGAMTRSVTSQTWGASVPVRQVALDLARKLEGVAVDDARVSGLDGRIDGGGWSFAGATKSALDRLAEEQGFSWSIVDGVFQAIGDAASFGGGAYRLNGDGGPLISVSPVLEGPAQIRTGVKIQALYTPGIAPGSLVQVESTINPGLNGQYKVGSLSLSLDSHGQSWTADIETTKFGI